MGGASFGWRLLKSNWTKCFDVVGLLLKFLEERAGGEEIHYLLSPPNDSDISAPDSKNPFFADAKNRAPSSDTVMMPR